MLYGDWIGRWGRSSPDREALVDVVGNRRYSYGQLAKEVYRMGHFLGSLGIRKGDRVAVLSFNRAEYLTLFFAASRLGAILVPLNTRLAPGEFIYYLEDCAPATLFFDEDHQAIVEKMKSKVKVEHPVCLDGSDAVGQSLTSLWKSLPSEPPPEVPIDPSDPQLIIYTSGTTGIPKGVILTHSMITWNSINTNLGWGLRSEDRTVLHSSLFYTAGWNVLTLPVCHCRGTNVLVRGFDADLILDLIEREHLTLFFGVPTMYQMLLESPKFSKADFSSIRFLVSGGAPLPKNIIEKFQTQKGIRLWEGYGLTEVGPNNFLANGKPGTVGNPMPHVDIKVVDSGGKEVRPGQDGELLLQGEHMCAGYWKKPEATSEAIRDGWFHTGDLARTDEDGHVSIVGRKKDMIISGGINIYPAEVEKVIESHPLVAAAAVIGVSDEKWGEVGKAILELKPGGKLTVEELQNFLVDRLGKYKIPKYAVIVKELPRTTSSGKIQKFILKERHGKPGNE
ncbi:MAG TPA: long-chain fatty acid--CoA ligase [Thermodesulfobacteriota bacterium]|nr:long-chain fatty acid--CoA ligase [Thermodesulfobacteriota bacterium]